MFKGYWYQADTAHETVIHSWGSWVAQLVKHPTSAQVIISWLMGSSPASGSLLTAWSLKPASDSVSPPLSFFLSPTHALSLSFYA